MALESAGRPSLEIPGLTKTYGQIRAVGDLEGAFRLLAREAATEEVPA